MSASSGQTHIVLVEDSRTQAVATQRELMDAGFSVDVARNGKEGLEACRRRKPHLVVSDVVMPIMDGFELCRQLRADETLKWVPVLLLTALTGPEDVLAAVEAGADNYLTKPYDQRRLIERVRHMTGTLPPAPAGNNIFVRGQQVTTQATRGQLVALFLSALEDAVDRNKQLAESREALQRAHDNQKEMMGVVAHELGTPLQTLLLRAQMASAGNAKRLGELPDVVERETRVMSSLLQDLLQSAELEAGTLAIDIAPTPLTPLLHNITDRFSATTTHTLVVHARDELTLLADAARVSQVITNLVSNAFKYAPPGTLVEIIARRDAGMGRVEVVDQGPGIDEADAAMVFDRFYRTPAGRKSSKGVGLGLHVCKKLIELHGGWIGVESELGRGSTFFFVVPLA